MKEYLRAVAKIDLDAIEYNMEQICHHIAPNTKVIAVVKADAYGHGARPIAHLLEQHPSLWGFAAATLDEAVFLRESGITKPILVLGCIFPDQYVEVIKNDVCMTVYEKEVAYEMATIAKALHKEVKVHIKIETGMSRLGFLPGEESVQDIKEISQMEGICLEGIFTHFAKADEVDKEYTRTQMTIFESMVERLKEEGVTFPMQHCSNSAGIIDLPEVNKDAVRAGIILYGMYPSEEVKKETIKLCPALSLYTHVEYVKWIKKGTKVSYGGTFETTRDTLVATLPIGYADGYPRSLSNKGWVLIHGKKAPILGRVCMDQMMVDVTDIPETSYCDVAVLIGKSGQEEITVDDLSRLSGRFNYEFVCVLNKRIPRIYVRNGKTVEQIDYFH